MTSVLHDFIDRAGDGAVLMVSPEARRDIRHNSSVHDWCFVGNREIYRGASVELHDEWSWGWMVRKADGKYVKPAIAMEASGRDGETRLDAEHDSAGRRHRTGDSA